MSYATERRLLQIAVAIGGLVPVSAGFLGLMGGLGSSTFADSHYRYLSGLLLGIGAAYWATIRGIESRGELFRTLTLIVAVGGLARLGAALAIGGNWLVWASVAMELVVTPLLALWRERIQRMDATPPPGYRGPWQ